MIRNNYHTHTIYCDGKNTPEELVKEALSLGCTEIGFTGHSYTDIPDENPFCMSPESTIAYKQEIKRLKEKYKDQIRILLGVEQDYFSEFGTEDYEYIIGSVHYVYKNGVYFSIDDTKEIQEKAVKEFYGGDFYSLVEDYYELVGNLYQKTGCNIIGHFDIITKFNEGNCLFDINHPRYVAAADKALKKLLDANVMFEINYGAISRGYRTEPFPDKRLSALIAESGAKTIISSDCHDLRYLLFGIDKENILELKQKA